MICPTLLCRVLAFMLVLFVFESKAQTNADSLLNVYSSGKADASTYNELIWVYVFNQPDSAIFFGNKGLRWCEKNKRDSLLASIHNRIGVAYDIKSMPDSALHFYNRALAESRRTKNLKTEGGALNNIGLICWNKGQADKAIDYYIQSAEIFEKIENMMGLGNTYNNIALILFEEGQYEKSLRYQHQSLSVRRKINHEYGIGASYANIGQLYTTDVILNLDSALYYIQLSIPIKEKLKDLYGLARSYHSLADIYLTTKAYDLALVNFNNALRLQLQIGNSEGYASAYYNIASVYSRQEDRKTQLVYLDSAQLFAEENKDLSLLWKVYREKARALSKIGSYKEAYPFWVSYTGLKDSLLTAERSEKVQELETRFRTAEQERELSEKKAALSEAKLKVENRDKWLVGLLSGIISLLLFGFGLFQTYKRRAQAEKDAAIISERERGLRAIIDATEEERKRIAKDLHDGIVQTLTGLSLRLQKQFSSLSASKAEKDEFSQSQALLDESIGEVRTISHKMMPRALSEMGLIPALDDLLNKSLGNSDIEYGFEHHKVEGVRFAENVEISLYRITQELINNIIKHSEAMAVSVQLLETTTHLVFVVEDN